jgi:hypothetical protein
MTIDLEILRDVLKSFEARDASLVAMHDPSAVNAHRGLLLREGFAGGGAHSPEVSNGQPLAWEYSVWSLTEVGKDLLERLLDDGVWNRTKHAYAMADCSWPLSQLYVYMHQISA